MKLAIALLCVLLGSSFAQAAHHNDMTWTWAQGNGGVATGFNVKWSAATGGPYTTIQALPVTTLTFSDTLSTRLTEGTHNFYVITATGQGGESVPSNEINLLTPFSVPTKPTLSGTAF